MSSVESVEVADPINWVTMAGAVVTLVNAALSASLLTLPFAFRKGGIILCVLLIVVFAGLARFIDWRLVRYGRRFRSATYADMISNALGARVGIILSGTAGLSLFVGLIGLLVLVGDLVTPIMQHWFGKDSMLGNRTPLTLLVSLFFILPLGTLPSVSMLKYSSFLTVMSMVFMTFVVILRATQKVGVKSGTIPNATPDLWNWSWEAFRAAPVIWYNSGFIFQAIPVLAPSPKQFTRSRMLVVMAVVTFIVSALMISLGVSGYLTFFDHSNGNILTNYAIDDTLVGICRALVTVVVVCSYPLFNMPLRDSVFYLLRHLRDWNSGKITHTAEDDAAFAAAEADSSSHASTPPASHETCSTTSEENTSEEMVRLDFNERTVEAISAETPSAPVSTSSSTAPSTEHTVHEQVPSGYKLWMRCFIQTFVCWIAAFTIAYVIPDITVIIGFVASTFSPFYYFALPACVALSLPERTTRTKVGGVFLLCACVYFVISGLGTYLLPKNIMYPPLPTSHYSNVTATLVAP